MFKFLDRWSREENGATAIEYGLMVAGISIMLLVAVFAFGDNVNTMFETLDGWIFN